MRNHGPDAKGEAVGGSAAANGAAAVGRKRRKPRMSTLELSSIRFLIAYLGKGRGKSISRVHSDK